jgi:hypothetical protein
MAEWFKRAGKALARAAGVTAALGMVWGFSAPSTPRDIGLAANAVLLKLATSAATKVLQDSKWGPIGRLQEAINARAATCGVAPVTQDGQFGRATAVAAHLIATCQGAPGETASGANGANLTVEAWKAVTGEAAPDALERARTLARTLESTDYDQLEWNVCVKFKGDQGSVLTWGPYGKTLGWGGEIMSVLKRLDPQTVKTVFAAEGAQGVDKLLALKTAKQLKIDSRHVYPGARALMEGVCRKRGQMTAWRNAFARLGAMPAVQAAYEDVAWGDEGWFRYVVERLSRSWQEAGLEPTEIDFAFFIDRSIHMGWGDARFAAVDKALADLKNCVAPEAFTNARARLAVADVVRAKAHPEDRIARDAMFLVDSEDKLSEAMTQSGTWPKNWKALWARRSGIAASDVGLSDDRPAAGFDDYLRAGQNGAAPGPG